jgi:hypothetical protein
MLVWVGMNQLVLQAIQIIYAIHVINMKALGILDNKIIIALSA